MLEVTGSNTFSSDGVPVRRGTPSTTKIRYLVSDLTDVECVRNLMVYGVEREGK